MKTQKKGFPIIAIVEMVFIADNSLAQSTNIFSNLKMSSDTLGACIMILMVFSGLLFYYVKARLEKRKQDQFNKYEHLNKLHRRRNRNFWRRHIYRKECELVDLYKSNLW